MQRRPTYSQDLRWLRGELERLMAQVNPGGAWAAIASQPIFHPPTDVYETDEGLIVKIEIAGMREDDFRIALVEGTLVVAGVRRDTLPKRGVHQMEISWGPFQTEVAVHMPVRESEIEARYEMGFLVIELPKAQRRRIPIHSRDEE